MKGFLTKFETIMICCVLLLCMPFFMFPSSAASADVDTSMNPAQQALLDLVTNQYIEETRDIVLDFNAPMPVERVKNCYKAWKIRTFEEYRNYYREKGEKDEYWLSVGAKGRYAFANAEYMTQEGYFIKYVSIEAFDNDVLSHNTEHFFCDDKGRPLSYKVNFTDKINKGLAAGVDKLIKGGFDNFYTVWRDSEVAILYAGELDPTSKAAKALVSQFGVVGFNMTENNLVKAKLDNIFAINLGEYVSVINFHLMKSLGLNEVEGITGDKLSGYNDSIKHYIHANVLMGLKGDLKDFGSDYLVGAKERADIYGLSMTSDIYNRLVELTLTVIEVPVEFNEAGSV